MSKTIAKLLRSHNHATSLLVVFQLLFTVGAASYAVQAQSDGRDNRKPFSEAFFGAKKFGQRHQPSAEESNQGQNTRHRLGSDTRIFQSGSIAPPQFGRPDQWTALPGPQTGFFLSLLKHSNRIYAGSSGGVFVSDDNGHTWQISNRGFATYVLDIAVSGNSILASTEGGKVWRTIDQGATWIDASAGLPVGPPIASLAVVGTSVFAVPSGGQQLYRSTDDGQHWNLVPTALPDGPPPSLFNNVTLVVGGSTLLAQTKSGVYLSIDEGDHWVLANLNQPAANAIAATAAGRKLFIGVNGVGVFVSFDGGQSWTVASNGLPTQPQISALRATDNAIFCITADGAMFMSINDGATWSASDRDLAAGIFVSDIVQAGTSLLAGTFAGVVRSENGGQSWEDSSRGITAGSLDGGMLTVGRNLYCATQGGVWVSSNKGQAWRRLNQGIRRTPMGFLWATSLGYDEGVLYAGFRFDGLYRSLNAGATWELVENGLPDGASPITIKSIHDKLFVGYLEAGLWVSSDNGGSWNQVGGLPEDTPWFKVLEFGPSIYAGSYGGGVFRSDDNGVTWKPMNEGLDELSQYINDIHFYRNTMLIATDSGAYRKELRSNEWQPINFGIENADAGGVNGLFRVGQRLFAATYGGGIYVSTNNGDSWLSFTRGLTSARFYSFEMQGNDLFVGSAGNGIFVLRDAATDRRPSF